MNESIVEAYCVELDRVVDIDEAREAFFLQPDPQKRFTFLCSDAACRNLPVPAQVTGVNYAAETYKTTPHFRRHPDYEHAETCIWGLYNAVLRDMVSRKSFYREASDNNLFVEFDDFDSSAVFDELYIRKDNEERKNSATSASVDKHRVRKDLEDHIIKTPKRTSSLANLVDMFRSLNDVNKEKAQLTLPGTPRLPYRKAFKHVRNYRHFFTWTHIYYGEAKIYHYKRPEPGYRVFFQNAVCRYTDDDDMKFGLTAFIPDEELDSSKGLHELKNYLETYSKSKELCCCYLLANSTHLQNLTLSGGDIMELVEIELDSLRDIVLRETTPNCE